MKRTLIILSMLLFVSAPLSWGEDEAPTFKLNVVQDQYLPPDMYGTWSIEATVRNSNAPPWFYAPSAHELWTLGQDDNAVFLENIVNSAHATVQVDRVQGNTATFHHVANVPSRRIQIIEAPTITVTNNTLRGYNHQTVIVYNRKQKEIGRYALEIELSGSRLSDAKTVFGTPDAPPKRFEIAPMRYVD